MLGGPGSSGTEVWVCTLLTEELSRALREDSGTDTTSWHLWNVYFHALHTDQNLQALNVLQKVALNNHIFLAAFIGW